MTLAYIASHRRNRGALEALVERAGWQPTIVALGSFCLALEKRASLPPAHALAASGDRTLVLVGDVVNRQWLRSLLGIYDSAALTANDAELVWLALDRLGETALALVEGHFVGLLADAASGTLSLFTDCTGQMPAYATREADPWVVSELKYLRLREDFQPQFEPAREVARLARRFDDYCPIRNVRKVKPGERLVLGHDGLGGPVVESSLYHAFRPGADRPLARDEALSMIDAILGACVSQCADGAERLGVPLSGGLDSSLVTALAARSVPQLFTFSIGTELSNEFEFAETVAQHVGTRHRAYLLSEEETMMGLIESIYHNEIFDGLSAEIQAPLFALYRKVAGTIDTLITGYGADLLFGGVLSPGEASRAVNVELWDKIYRTRWTGEFGGFGARHHGIRVRHPFWSNRLLGLCLDLDPVLKVSREEIKVVLRELAARKELLPHDIVWRKKIGIHEGSAINRMFATKLDASVLDYELKTRFSYFVYREFFEHGHTPSTVDAMSLFRRFLEAAES